MRSKKYTAAMKVSDPAIVFLTQKTVAVKFTETVHN